MVRLFVQSDGFNEDLVLEKYSQKSKCWVVTCDDDQLEVMKKRDLSRVLSCYEVKKWKMTKFLTVQIIKLSFTKCSRKFEDR